MSKRFNKGKVKKPKNVKPKCPKHHIQLSRKLVTGVDGKNHIGRRCILCEDDRAREVAKWIKEQDEKQVEEREYQELMEGFDEVDELLS